MTDTDGDVGGYSLGHVTRYSLDSDSARHSNTDRGTIPERYGSSYSYCRNACRRSQRLSAPRRSG